jgi:hypothetical protein
LVAQHKSQVEIARKLIGQPIDGLSLADRWKFSGVWVALEVYTPQKMPLRMIEAVGGSAAECIRHLISRGLDASRFEFIPLPQPYET